MLEKRDGSKEDPNCAVKYLTAVLCGLKEEVGSIHNNSNIFQNLSNDIDILRQASATVANPTYSEWQNLWQQYETLVKRKGGALNELANIAQEYLDMEGFWEDYHHQLAGNSRHTIWDTYEHGRRRQLEFLLAQTYGSESALLLNSGMSAVAVTIGMMKLSKGDTILTGDRCYFETSTYLEQFVAGSEVNIVRVPTNDPDLLLSALEKHQPKLAIFETVTNVPDVCVVSGYSKWLTVSPETTFLIDNSVQSHLTRWFEILAEPTDKVLVMESAIKYITHNCMAGIMYGSQEIVEKARDYARVSGQQLQEKSFNYLCEAEIGLVSQKLSIHSENVSIFKEELSSYLPLFKFVHSLDTKSEVSPQLFERGHGSLIYLSLHSTDSSSALLDKMHRNLLKTWCSLAKEAKLNLPVRCGFGWANTIARVYESGTLNQQDGTSYLRISIGIEPSWIIRILARTLGEAARQLINERGSTS
jgi:cystathionine beta-lyase/cystathionine gamma-synthase